MRLLYEKGYQVYGIEPSFTMVALAQKETPALRERFLVGEATTLPKQFQHANLDGILCNAVLMHIPDEELDTAIAAMAKALKKGGRLLLYTSAARPNLTNDLDETGRLFKVRPQAAIEPAFQRHGLILKNSYKQIPSQSANKPGRQGIFWDAYIFEKA